MASLRSHSFRYNSVKRFNLKYSTSGVFKQRKIYKYTRKTLVHFFQHPIISGLVNLKKYKKHYNHTLNFYSLPSSSRHVWFPQTLHQLFSWAQKHQDRPITRMWQTYFLASKKVHGTSHVETHADRYVMVIWNIKAGVNQIVFLGKYITIEKETKILNSIQNNEVI